MPKQHRLKREQILHEYHESGLTQDRFAKSKGMSVHTLRSWIYKNPTATHNIKADDISKSTVLFKPVQWTLPSSEILKPEALPKKKRGAFITISKDSLHFRFSELMYRLIEGGAC
jgi:hypothetical protein